MFVCRQTKCPTMLENGQNVCWVSSFEINCYHLSRDHHRFTAATILQQKWWLHSPALLRVSLVRNGTTHELNEIITCQIRNSDQLVPSESAERFIDSGRRHCPTLFGNSVCRNSRKWRHFSARTANWIFSCLLSVYVRSCRIAKHCDLNANDAMWFTWASSRSRTLRTWFSWVRVDCPNCWATFRQWLASWNWCVR